MKNILKFSVLSFRAIILLFLICNNCQGQTIISPSNTDNLFAASVPVTYLNNALARYYDPTSLAYQPLMAVMGGNGTVAFIKIYDGATSYTTTITPPSGYTSVIWGDIAVGGSDDPSLNTTYYVGVIYEAHTSGGVADICMNTYQVSNPGTTPGSMTVSAVCTNTLTSTGGFQGEQPPHIDIIGDTDPMSGYVSCDKFIATAENIGGTGAKVYGMFSSLSAGSCSVGTTQLISVGKGPDVAGVLRSNSAYGLFAYRGNSSDIEYREWNINTNTVSSATVLHTLPASNEFNDPRIDATDDVNLNNDPSIAHYVVSNVDDATGDIYQYNDLTASQNCSSSLGVAENYPGVACGPGANYTIGYYNGYGGSNNLYAQQVDFSTGTASSSYYQVNNTPGATISAISKTCDAVYADQIFITWYNPVTGNVMYKLNSSAPPSFKPAPTSVTSVSNAGDITLYPNPATGILTLNNTGNVPVNNYRITDITGRETANGRIESTKQTIDVTDLPSGMYLMNIYNAGTKTQTIKFVKE